MRIEIKFSARKSTIRPKNPIIPPTLESLNVETEMIVKMKL